MSDVSIICLVIVVGVITIFLAACWADGVKNRAPKGPKMVYNTYNNYTYPNETKE